jgi:hypothetical protein
MQSKRRAPGAYPPQSHVVGSPTSRQQVLPGERQPSREQRVGDRARFPPDLASATGSLQGDPRPGVRVLPPT